MQWRTVARRGPYASWTVVGDLAQRSRTAEPRDWEAVAPLIGRRAGRRPALSVNYRTPVEIVEVARAVLAAAGHDPAAVPTAVRRPGSGRGCCAPTDLVARGRSSVVAAPPARARARSPSSARRTGWPGSNGRDAAVVAPTAPAHDRVRVHDPRTPRASSSTTWSWSRRTRSRPLRASVLHQLYVAVTRATRSLTVIATPGAAVPGADHLDPGGVPD